MDALAGRLEPLLVEALQLLPPCHRAVLVLRDLEGFSAVETAEVLGCTTAQVEAAHRRARRSLALVLDGRQLPRRSADGVGGVVR